MGHRKILIWLIVLVAPLVLALVFWVLWPKAFSSRIIGEDEKSADVDFPIVLRVKGGMLEVASVTGKRYFGGATDPVIFGIPIPYCREKSGWHASYKITYRLRLGERWQIRYRQGELLAKVPELEPSLPVAFDSSSLGASGSEKCWFMLPMQTKDRVLRRISADLRKSAQSQRTKRFAREDARTTVIEYLRTWEVNHGKAAGIASDAKIRVFFPGE